MKRLTLACLMFAVLLTCGAARAEGVKPDDQVAFDLSAENWVTTKTARVVLNIEAAVTASSSGSMRASMMKAVGEVVKADWRLIAFSRMQDQTGMERWSAQYEARLPENELNGLTDAAKKISKAGLQVTVAGIDFSPTMEERQAVMAQTRTQIYKQAGEQLTALNAALPGRSYRIASIDFSGDTPAVPPRVFMQNNAKMGRVMAMANAAVGADMAESSAAMEKSEKITLTAHVVMAAVPPGGGEKK